MPIESRLFQGNSQKYTITDTFLECGSCGALFEESGPSCLECDAHIAASDTNTKTVDVADCAICGDAIAYTRDNRVNTNYNIFGYICRDCENIVELRFRGSFYEPIPFLKNGLGKGFNVQHADSRKEETITWMFSLQTKVENVGFWSYQPDEYKIWLASFDSTYCGYVSLNNDNILNQIWVDQGYRRSGIAAQLVKYVCTSVLQDKDELVISQPTDEGREFFESIQQGGNLHGKELKISY